MSKPRPHSKSDVELLYADVSIALACLKAHPESDMVAVLAHILDTADARTDGPPTCSRCQSDVSGTHDCTGPRFSVWQPIATIPEHAQFVLGYWPVADSFDVGEMLKEESVFWDTYGTTRIYPTHWMPLPTSPSEVLV